MPGQEPKGQLPPPHPADGETGIQFKPVFSGNQNSQILPLAAAGRFQANHHLSGELAPAYHMIIQSLLRHLGLPHRLVPEAHRVIHDPFTASCPRLCTKYSGKNDFCPFDFSLHPVPGRL